MIKKIILFFCASVSLSFTNTFAQSGNLLPDITFNNTSTLVRDSFDTKKMLVMQDGRILCVGTMRHPISQYTYTHDFSVSCLLPNGTIDNTFGNNGYLTIDNGYTDEEFWHIENFGNGFLLVGYYNLANNNQMFYNEPGGDCIITKMDQNGVIDNTFGTNGITQLSLNPKFNVTDIKITANNDIFLLVNQQPYFGTTDKGKILKLNAFGQIDTNYGIQGIAEIPMYLPQKINILPNGDFIVLASYNSSSSHPGAWQYPHLCKLDALGNIDYGFGVNGKILISYNNLNITTRRALAYGDGFYIYGDKGYIGNSYQHNLIYKVDNNGNFITAWGNNGEATVSITDPNGSITAPWIFLHQEMKLQNNDLWLCGTSEIYGLNCHQKEIIRIDSSGIQDITLGQFHCSVEPIFDEQLQNAYYIYPFINCFEESKWRDICFQSDGKILAAGYCWGDTSLQTMPYGFIISRLLIGNTSPTSIDTHIACDSHTWIDGNTYTHSNHSATFTIQNGSVSGSDSVVTLDLTILHSTTLNIYEIACNNYTLNGQTYTSSGTYVQTLTNIAGCDSTITLNLTIAQPSSSTLTEVACGSYILNGQTYTTSGTYVQTLTNIAGCDSTITLNLTINNPILNTAITADAAVLTAQETAATYQWIDCNNNNATIVGAITQSYTATTVGNYAVVLTSTICTDLIDTTACELVDFSGLATLSTLTIKLYPNPTENVVFVETDVPMQTLVLRDVNGKLISTIKLNTSFASIDVKQLCKGLYFIEMTDMKNIHYVSKFVKE